MNVQNNNPDNARGPDDRNPDGKVSADHEALAPKPTLLQLFLAFVTIGATSFGGGVSGWMRLEFVNRRRWMTLDNFFLGASLGQSLPGVNVLNLAIWVGFELHRTPGVLVAAAGVLVPPSIFVILLAEFFERISGYAVTHLVLAGVAVGGLAMALSLGLVAAHRRVRDVTSALVFAAAFASIFIFHIPMLIVLLVLTPLSIGLAYWKIKRHA